MIYFLVVIPRGLPEGGSQYSVPKNGPNPVLPNYALEKLDMGKQYSFISIATIVC